MKAYKDFWGGELLNSNDIDNCTTTNELEGIVWRHECHLEDQLSDAKSHLQHLKERLF